MSFPYAKIGNNCSSITSAYTSNAKYIMPYSPVYYMAYTPMMNYPSSDVSEKIKDNIQQGKNSKPESVKAFVTEENNPYNYDREFRMNYDPRNYKALANRRNFRGGCKSCNSG